MGDSRKGCYVSVLTGVCIAFMAVGVGLIVQYVKYRTSECVCPETSKSSKQSDGIGMLRPNAKDIYGKTPTEQTAQKKAEFYKVDCPKFLMFLENLVAETGRNGFAVGDSKHAVLGQKDVKKWEAAPGVVDALERCGMHPGEALKL
ncbi:hypothetical protein MAR_011979, partial [Mya arenaria]